jgi:hypothetical protein
MGRHQEALPVLPPGLEEEAGLTGKSLERETPKGSIPGEPESSRIREFYDESESERIYAGGCDGERVGGEPEMAWSLL